MLRKPITTSEDKSPATSAVSEVMAAMQSLPEQFRVVVYCVDIEGFRYREIADVMGTRARNGDVTTCAAFVRRLG